MVCWCRCQTSCQRGTGAFFLLFFCLRFRWVSICVCVCFRSGKAVTWLEPRVASKIRRCRRAAAAVKGSGGSSFRTRPGGVERIRKKRPTTTTTTTTVLLMMNLRLRDEERTGKRCQHNGGRVTTSRHGAAAVPLSLSISRYIGCVENICIWKAMEIASSLSRSRCSCSYSLPVCVCVYLRTSVHLLMWHRW